MARRGKGALPPPTIRVYDWWKIAAEARRNEDKWGCCLRQVTKSLPGAHRRGAMKALWPDGEWTYELRVRNTNGTKGDIWIMATRSNQEEMRA